MAKTTASASGREQISGDAARKNIGTKTMQMHSSETAPARDLPGAVENGGPTSLPCFEMRVDVFDGDRGVVDQDADGEREAAQRHHIDGLADRRQRDERGEDRQRDRTVMISVERQLPRNSRIIRPVSVAAIIPRGSRRDRRFDETGLVADELDVDARRQAGLRLSAELLDAGDDVQRRGIAGLQDRHQHALAIDAHHIGLRGEPSCT